MIVEVNDSLCQRILPKLPSNPTLLEPTEWHIRVQAIHAINPRSPRLEPMRRVNNAAQVLREHSGSKPINRVVRLLDHIVFVFELDDDTDGTEDLFLDDLHRWVDVGEDGGLDEVAFCSLTLSADLDFGPCLLSGLDVGHDTLCNREDNGG